MASTETHERSPGSLAAAISNLIVRLFSEYTGRGPNKARVTTAWPSAASVQASTTASTAASERLIPVITRAPTNVPAAIVSGRPMPRSRSGTAKSRRSAPNEISRSSRAPSSRSGVSRGLSWGGRRYWRAIATRSRSSGAMRWSASSASSPSSICTQLTVPVKTLLSAS
jgi:hypothetical protein